SRRCCASSSTISASRSGVSETKVSRARSSCFQSRIFQSCNSVNRGHELEPGTAMRFENLASFESETVIATAALAGLFDPTSGDPSSFLHAIEQRIQGGDVEAELGFGSLLE